eukprot:3668620-Alexandrium_andersonii.AAC.1
MRHAVPVVDAINAERAHAVVGIVNAAVDAVAFDAHVVVADVMANVVGAKRGAVVVDAHVDAHAAHAAVAHAVDTHAA